MGKRPKILVVNDDGIEAEGLIRLASAACELGDVWVAAPARQCSGMSMKLSIFEAIKVTEESFPAPVRRAWRIDGTPTDCVKLALNCLMNERPDFVLSGINNGCNTGFDIAYSGTMGAATEALMEGIPSIAFSKQEGGSFAVTDTYLLPLLRELIKETAERQKVVNVNFPSCPLHECRGIERGVPIAATQMYSDRYIKTVMPDGTVSYKSKSILIEAEKAPDGSDISAVFNGYVAISDVSCNVL